VLLALLFFGTHLDDFNRPPVYLVVLGFAGSLSLALFQEKRTRDVIYINVLIYFFFAIVASMLRPITAVILLVYYTAMLLAVYTYVVHFDKKIADAFFIRPLLLAATVGVLYIAANFIHGLMFISRFSTKFLLANLPVGFLLGFGYGAGYDICRWLLLRHGHKAEH
jgi:hypothetical protein